MRLMECYYTSNPSQKGYMQQMWDLWMLQNPTYKLTTKQLVDQCSNFCNQQLISCHKIDEEQQQSYGKWEQGRQVSGRI